MRRTVIGSADLDAETLTTDVTRFMAIFGFCTMAILALVHNADSVRHAKVGLRHAQSRRLNYGKLVEVMTALQRAGAQASDLARSRRTGGEGTTHAATRYGVPTLLALLVHAVVLSSLLVVWTKPIDLHEYEPPPIVKAKLVMMEAPKPKVPPPLEAKPTPPKATPPPPPEAKPTPPPEAKPTPPPEAKLTSESTPRDAPKSAEPVPPVAKQSLVPLAKRSTPMAPQPLAKSEPPPAMPPAPRPSPVAVKSAPAVPAEKESLMLRFTSDTDFLKLVSGAVIEVYAYDAATAFKLSPGLTFAPAARPPQVRELLAETIPSLVREALVRTASANRPLVWGVRLPRDIESNIARHLAQERTGVLLIDRKGSVQYVASKSRS